MLGHCTTIAEEVLVAEEVLMLLIAEELLAVVAEETLTERERD
jgi:hypothetical protein